MAQLPSVNYILSRKGANLDPLIVLQTNLKGSTSRLKYPPEVTIGQGTLRSIISRQGISPQIFHKVSHVIVQSIFKRRGCQHLFFPSSPQHFPIFYDDN